MNASTQPTALADVRVLDLSTFIAGPYATKLLADFGADVIKVEPPSGDAARRVGPFVHDQPDREGSLLFLYLNTNKRSVTLDIWAAPGKSLLKALVQWADVVVESFPPGTLADLGLAYKDLSQINQSIVLVSVTPFGQMGPYRDFKGGELPEFALGGFMYTYGDYDREPIKHGGYQVAYHTGTNAATATLVALYHRRVTGQGQHVDIAGIECQAATIRDTTSIYGYMGAIRRRAPRREGENARQRQLVAAKDGYFIGGDGGIPRAGLRPVSWEQVAAFVGREELRAFATEEARKEHAHEIRAILDEEFQKRSKYDIVEAAQQRHFMYGPVETPADVVTSPQLAARGYFVEAEHPATGAIPFPGAPFAMTETPWRLRTTAPTLGQHNEEVYGAMLGRSAEELTGLRDLGVI